MSGSDELGVWLAATDRTNNQRTMSARVADVTATGVNLIIGEALVTNVPCADSYQGRKRGDWVAVRISAGQPVVMWRLGASSSPEQTLESIALGSGPAPAGYVQADSVHVRRNADGSLSVYVRSSAAAPWTPGQGTQPPPDVGRILRANDTGAWWGGARDVTQTDPAQGARPQTPTVPVSGGWFYGTAIADACAGKTVANMTLRIIRTEDGPVERTPLHLYTHSYTDAPASALALDDGPEDLLSFSPGASEVVTLPEYWWPLFASGTRRGFAVYAGTDPYTSYESPKAGPLGTVCGDVEITFG